MDAPVLAFYGDQDANLMQTLPDLKRHMAVHNKEFEPVIYEGAGHAFFNETNARQYKPDYAKDAWAKTLAFLKKNLA
jgi:carboxymethylenebutenolidase